MTTWFTSDLHFGHANIIKYAGRPYVSVDEMNGELIENWNQRVKPGDVTYVIGDACIGKLTDTLPLVDQLHGTKVLILGNHDRPHPAYKQSVAKRAEWTSAYGEVFDHVTMEMELEVAPGVTVRMNHFPYLGAHDVHDRNFTQWMPADDRVRWLLHGHVHTQWRVREEARMINVGTDVWGYRPISLDTIQIILGVEGDELDDDSSVG